MSTGGDGDEPRTSNAGRCRRGELVWCEPVIGGVDEQRRDGDVLEREVVRRRFGLQRVERDPVLLRPDWEQRFTDAQEVLVARGVPPLRDTHDAGKARRSVPLEEPPAKLPAGDGAHERVQGLGDRLCSHARQVGGAEDQPKEPVGVS